MEVIFYHLNLLYIHSVSNFHIMNSSSGDNSSATIIKILKLKLYTAATLEAKEWLEKKLSLMENDFTNRDFFICFSGAFRFFSKDLIPFSEEELELFKLQYNCWNPTGIKVFELARLIIFLHLPQKDVAQYIDIVKKLLSTADIGELVTLFRCLILYPFAEEYKIFVADGIRTNIKNVFEAIALDNPYPAKYLDEKQWNQMVLKSVFNGSPLYRIVGLEQRANASLSQQLSDYAHERWAAGRMVNPELWRAAAPFTNDVLIKDLERLFNSEHVYEQQAAALAAKQSGDERALLLLNKFPVFKKDMEQGILTWDTFSKAWYQSLVLENK